MKTLTTILSLVVTLSSVSALAIEPQIDTQACQDKVMAQALTMIKNKIQKTKSLSALNEAMTKSNGDVRSVLAMRSARVSGMGKYIGEDFEQQLAYVYIPAKSNLGWLSFTVNLTVNDACTHVQYERNVVVSPMMYQDSYVNGE